MKTVGLLLFLFIVSVNANVFLSTLKNQPLSDMAFQDSNGLDQDPILRSFIDDFVAKFGSRLQKTYIPRMKIKNEGLLEFLSTSCEEEKRKKGQGNIFQEFQTFQGSQGSQGSQTSQGSQASQGSQGSQASQGSQGSQGSQTSQASQGSQGSQTSQASQGSQGSQTSQGSQGSQTSPNSSSQSQGIARDPVKDFLIKILSTDAVLNRQNGSVAIPVEVRRLLKEYIFRRLSLGIKPDGEGEELANNSQSTTNNVEQQPKNSERQPKMGVGDVILEGLNKFNYNGAKISETAGGNKISIQLDFGPVYLIPILSNIDAPSKGRAYTLFQVVIHLNLYKATFEAPTSVSMQRLVVSEPEEKDIKLVLCDDLISEFQKKEYLQALARDLKKLRLRRFYGDIVENMLAGLHRFYSAHLLRLHTTPNKANRNKF